MPKILLNINTERKKRKRKRRADDEVWPTFIPEDDQGVGAFQVEFYDGATKRQALSSPVLFIDQWGTWSVTASGDLRDKIIARTQLIFRVKAIQEDETYREYDIVDYVEQVSYDAVEVKTTVWCFGDWPKGSDDSDAELVAAYYWKDAPNWDGDAGDDTVVFDSELSLNYGGWNHKPTDIYWKTHEYSAGCKDASAEYGDTNTDRWKRKQLHGTYNVIGSTAAEGANDRYDGTQSLTYSNIPPTKTWFIGQDFVNLKVELKSRFDETDPKYQASPDMIRTRTAKKLKKYTKSNKYGFRVGNTTQKKFHLKINEVGSKSICHYVEYDEEHETEEEKYLYCYDRLEKKTKASPETWRTVGLFFLDFDTSDTTNFKVTAGPLYDDSPEVSSKPINLVEKYEIYLMPRKWGYFARSRKGTHAGAVHTINVSTSTECECGAGGEGGSLVNWICTFGNVCMSAIAYTANLHGDGFPEFPFTQTHDQDGFAGGSCMASCIGFGNEHLRYDSTGCTHSVGYSNGAAVLQHNCTGGYLYYDPPWWCSPFDGASFCTAGGVPHECGTFTTNGSFEFSADAFRVDHNYAVWWDRWPNTWTYQLGKWQDYPHLTGLRNTEYAEYYYGWMNDYQQYTDDLHAYPSQAIGWSSFHFTPFESLTVVQGYEAEALCAFSQFNTVSDASEYLCYKYPRPDPLPPIHIPSYKRPSTMGGHYAYLGQLWNKVEDHHFWTTYGTGTFQAVNNQWSRWDNIPFAFGMSPAKEGTLCAVIRKKGSSKAYYVWRKTDEEFRLTLTKKDNNYGGHIFSPEWCGSLTPSETKDGTVPFEDDGFYDALSAEMSSRTEAMHNVYAGYVFPESVFEWGNVDQFYSENGLRESTHVGRAWELSSTTPYPVGDEFCTEAWAMNHYYTITPEPTTELDRPIYWMSTKERARRSTQMHEYDMLMSLAYGIEYGKWATGEPYDPSLRFIRTQMHNHSMQDRNDE